MELFTIGYEGINAQQLILWLKNHDINFVADVRNLPVMAGAFMIPGIGRAALGFAVDIEEPSINQQKVAAVSEVKHQWTKEEIDMFAKALEDVLWKS